MGKFFSRIGGFFGEVRTELKKVAFPGRSETIGSTAVVIVFVVILGIYLSIVDSLWMSVIGVIVR